MFYGYLVGGVCGRSYLWYWRSYDSDGGGEGMEGEELAMRREEIPCGPVMWKHSTCYCMLVLPLSPPGWRGIVVTVQAVGWAGGCQTCGTHISVTTWQIFSIRSSVELSRPLVVHCHGHLPICPKWACSWAKNCQICHQLGSNFVDRISLKPRDGCTPFKVSWTCLDL